MLRSAFAVAAVLGSSAAGQVVFFESFEAVTVSGFLVISAGNTLTGDAATWAVTAGTVDLVNAANLSETVQLDAINVVDMHGTPGPGTIETDVAVSAGSIYDLSFLYARNLTGASASMGYEVIGASGLLASGSVTHDASSMSVESEVARFTADGGSVRLRFIATAATNQFAGVTLDAVTLTLIPAPGVAAVAVAGVVAARRRR